VTHSPRVVAARCQREPARRAGAFHPALRGLDSTSPTGRGRRTKVFDRPGCPGVTRRQKWSTPPAPPTRGANTTAAIPACSYTGWTSACISGHKLYAHPAGSAAGLEFQKPKLEELVQDMARAIVLRAVAGLVFDPAQTRAEAPNGRNRVLGHTQPMRRYCMTAEAWSRPALLG
jgi:hypothetical protein